MTEKKPIVTTLERDAAIVEEFVRVRSTASFVETQRDLADQMPTHGELALVLPGKVVLWTGMSERLCAAVIRLVEQKRIVVKTSERLIYLIDGGALSLPLAKKHTYKRGYKRPRWLPTTMLLASRGVGPDKRVTAQLAAVSSGAERKGDKGAMPAAADGRETQARAERA